LVVIAGGAAILAGLEDANIDMLYARAGLQSMVCEIEAGMESAI